MRTLKSFIAALALSALLGVMLGGCDWLWPRDNPRDPVRCDPPCPMGLVCFEGICKLGDGGLPADGGNKDLSSTDMPPPDMPAPDMPPPDMPPPDAPIPEFP